MSFPIPVNMTVSENSVNYDMGIETKIVAGTEYEGPYSVTPTEQAQTLETQGKLMTGNVNIGAMPSGSVTIPPTSFQPTFINASISDSNGRINVQTSAEGTVVPQVTAGYVSSVASKKLGANVSGIGATISTAPGATITPTESQQTAVAKHAWTTGEVKVGAIPSNYVGSAVPRKVAADVSVNGSTVTIPAGYYAEPVTIQL